MSALSLSNRPINPGCREIRAPVAGSRVVIMNVPFAPHRAQVIEWRETPSFKLKASRGNRLGLNDQE